MLAPEVLLYHATSSCLRGESPARISGAPSELKSAELTERPGGESMILGDENDILPNDSDCSYQNILASLIPPSEADIMSSLLSLLKSVRCTSTGCPIFSATVLALEKLLFPSFSYHVTSSSNKAAATISGRPSPVISLECTEWKPSELVSTSSFSGKAPLPSLKKTLISSSNRTYDMMSL